MNWLRYLADLGSAKMYAASRGFGLRLAKSVASSRLEIGMIRRRGSLSFWVRSDSSLEWWLVELFGEMHGCVCLRTLLMESLCFLWLLRSMSWN